MINEKKIHIMTDLAMFAHREERRAMVVCRYRKRDYITIQMIKVWLAVTVAYMLISSIAVLCFVGGRENASLPFENFMAVFFLWGILYLVICLVFLILAFFSFGRYYREASIRMRRYYKRMKQMEEFYKENAGSGAPEREK